MTATTETTETFASRMRAKREDAEMSLLDVEWAMRSYRPDLAPHTYSYGTLERIERGAKKESSVDTVYLALLADIYGCTLEDLSPAASDRALRVVRLLDRKRGFKSRGNRTHPTDNRPASRAA